MSNLGKDGFDDWGADQDVKFTIIAEVNDVEAYHSSYSSLDGLEEDLRKPERAVQSELQDQYNDYIGVDDEEDEEA